MDFDMESENNIDGAKGCSVDSMGEWIKNDIS